MTKNRGTVSILISSLFFTLLQPGIVAGLVPYYLLQGAIGPILKKPFGLEQYGGIVLFGVGFVIMMECILRFAFEGRGTLSPADPTKKVVIKGLYRYSRNPMYVGVIGMLVGEAIFFEAGSFWIYVCLVAVAFHLFIIFIEEPRLRKDFAEEYEKYTRLVRRWF